MEKNEVEYWVKQIAARACVWLKQCGTGLCVQDKQCGTQRVKVLESLGEVFVGESFHDFGTVGRNFVES